MSDQIVLALSGLITFSLAFLFFYFPWQSLVVDQTLWRVQEIRDDWFNYSLELKNPQDVAAATLVRNELDFLIRVTPKVTFPTLVAMAGYVLVFGPSGVPSTPLPDPAGAFRSRMAGEKAVDALSEAFSSVVWGMIRRSLVLLLLAPLCALLVLVVSARFRAPESGMHRLRLLVDAVGREGDTVAVQ